MKRSGPPRRRSPIKRSPIKRGARAPKPWVRRQRTAPRRSGQHVGAELDDYREVKRIVRERARGACEANTPACLPGRHAGADCHHVIRRSQGGPDEAWNLLHVCRDGHRFIHDHPAQSFAAGWLRHGYPAPDELEEGAG